MSEQTEWTPKPAGLCSTTLRERWLAQMRYERTDRIPNFEFGYWAETLPEWHKQGLPESVDNEQKAYAYFGIENWGGCGVNTGLLPGFERQMIEETDDYITYIDGEGATCQEKKNAIHTIPHYLDFGLKTRDDWERYKERLDPTTPGRYPANWDERVAAFRDRDYPLYAPIGSLIGKPRNWVGFEGLAYMVHDDPALIEDIIEACCVCVCGTIEKALSEAEFDFGAGWEDICYRSGPILSPAMFDRWIVPRYKRITDMLHDHGIDIIWTDCDGNVVPIVPQFMAGGINCMFPIEVACGSDPLAMREQFGKDLLLHGGVNKQALSRGLKEVEQEIERLRPLVEQGGFIPHIDHRCPADVPLENYKHYMRLKRERLNAGDLVPHYDEA